jgi:hypothetical protein
VPDVCTCGAKLPEDARFCHKCGKPQRDEPLLVEDEAPVQAPLEPPDLAAPVPPRIGFHNALAVRVALATAALGLLGSMLLGQLPGLQLIAILCPMASGFLAVHLYRRKSGQQLSLASGAHLGWISGIFGFLITVLLFTAFAVMLTSPELANAVREQALSTKPEMAQAIREFQTAEGVARALAGSFILLTALPTFGATLGAKLLHRDFPPRNFPRN